MDTYANFKRHCDDFNIAIGDFETSVVTTNRIYIEFANTDEHTFEQLNHVTRKFGNGNSFLSETEDETGAKRYHAAVKLN